MVFIFDDESEFGTPIGKLWEYVPSEKHKHPTTKIISREVKGNVITVVSDRDYDGKMFRTKMQMTMHPPLGYTQEFLEGPSAGSKAFVFYRAKGDKTGITVVGDFKMAGFGDDDSTKKAVFRMLERSFDEDSATLKTG